MTTIQLTDTEFDALVQEAINGIPEDYRKLMRNVAIVVVDEPTPEQLTKTGLRHGQSLFGLYEGVPQISRGAGYSALPDKITIFKRAIVESCADSEEVCEQVKETVWHELAHHFGSSEQRVRRAQAKRRLRQ